MPTDEQSTPRMTKFTSPVKIFTIVVVVALLSGISTGFVLANSSSKNNNIANPTGSKEAPKSAAQDNHTFRDFAEGKITKKPEPKNANEYSEGTHLLVRENAVPVALTSSVVDLSQYEGKNVKIYGETQKAIKEGWLMDVGKVEEK